MFALSFIPIALLASQVAAVAAPKPFSDSHLIGLLATRQSAPHVSSSDIPEQCQSDCKALINLENTCKTGLDCLCSDSTGDAFVQCESCAVKLPGVTDDIKSLAQQTLDTLTSSCKDAGHPLSKKLSLSTNGATAVSPSVALVVLGGVAALLHVAS